MHTEYGGEISSKIHQGHTQVLIFVGLMNLLLITQNDRVMQSCHMQGDLHLIVMAVTLKGATKTTFFCTNLSTLECAYMRGTDRRKKRKNV